MPTEAETSNPKVEAKVFVGLISVFGLDSYREYGTLSDELQQEFLIALANGPIDTFRGNTHRLAQLVIQWIQMNTR